MPRPTRSQAREGIRIRLPVTIGSIERFLCGGEHALRLGERLSRGVCSLGELVDPYACEG